MRGRFPMAVHLLILFFFFIAVRVRDDGDPEAYKWNLWSFLIQDSPRFNADDEEPDFSDRGTLGFNFFDPEVQEDLPVVKLKKPSPGDPSLAKASVPAPGSTAAVSQPPSPIVIDASPQPSPQNPSAAPVNTGDASTQASLGSPAGNTRSKSKSPAVSGVGSPSGAPPTGGSGGGSPVIPVPPAGSGSVVSGDAVRALWVALGQERGYFGSGVPGPSAGPVVPPPSAVVPVPVAEPVPRFPCLNKGDKACPVCNKYLPKWATLKKHFASHQKIFRHKCQVCGKGFQRSGELKHHAKVHAPPELKPKCKVCQKVFAHEASLKMHLKDHKRGGGTCCHPGCGKADFSSAASLRVHESVCTHSPLYRGPFRCFFCASQFCYTKDRKRHHKNKHNYKE